jgi:hypothetical protein
VAQAVATSPSAPATNPVAIPASADGLAQQTDSTGQNVVAAMKKSDAGSSAAAFYSGALFAAYSKSGSDAIYADLTLVPMADSTDLEALYASQGASGALTTMGGASSFKDVQTIAAPMPNSAMDCGLVSADGLTLNSCTWIDASEFGIFVSTESISAAQAASYSEAFEATSEGVSQ